MTQYTPSTVGQGHYTHTQVSESATWTVNHNLGFKPSIEVLNGSGIRLMVHVIHVSDDQATVHFLSPQTGTAECSS